MSTDLVSRRVAYIALEPFPSPKGSGTRMTATVGALRDSGREVELITLPSRGPNVAPDGIRLRQVQVHARNYLQRALAFRDAVGRQLEASRPNVVHFRGIFEGQAALAYAKRRGIPAIFEANGLPSVELQYHYPAVGRSMSMLGTLRELEAKTLHDADVVLTQSQTTLAFLRGRGLPVATPSYVIPNGADLPDLDEAPQSPGVPTVLYAGTLAPWQGVAELLMAARRCTRVRPVHFVLAGPVRNRWRRQLERYLQRLRIEDSVEMTGPLARDVLTQRIMQADVCVAPLRRDVRNKSQGCSPIKLYEYMAAGRGVLTTDLPCTRELLDETRGVLVPSPRPKLLAERLLGMLDDVDGTRALGSAARAWVGQHATWAHRVRALTDVYDGLGC